METMQYLLIKRFLYIVVIQISSLDLYKTSFLLFIQINIFQKQALNVFDRFNAYPSLNFPIGY